MARVADHLSVVEPELRVEPCPDLVEARHMQAVLVLAQGRTIEATENSTALGSRRIEQLLGHYSPSRPESLANGRRNGLKSSLLTAEVLEVARL